MGVVIACALGDEHGPWLRAALASGGPGDHERHAWAIYWYGRAPFASLGCDMPLERLTPRLSGTAGASVPVWMPGRVYVCTQPGPCAVGPSLGRAADIAGFHLAMGEMLGARNLAVVFDHTEILSSSFLSDFRATRGRVIRSEISGARVRRVAHVARGVDEVPPNEIFASIDRGNSSPALGEIALAQEQRVNPIVSSGSVSERGRPSALRSRLAVYAGPPDPALTTTILADYEAPLDRVISELSRRTRTDYGQYKRGTLLRRLASVVLADKDYSGRESLGRVVEKLLADEASCRNLAAAFLIGVTRFFRDESAFCALDARVVRPLVHRAVERGSGVRVWVPSCSTGEEAYSLVILLLEAASAAAVRERLEITVFATDLDELALSTAQAGIYSAKQLDGMSATRRARFFEPIAGDRHRVNESLRSHVMFARHDMTVDPPFSCLDLVSCRNFLIYLQPSAQSRITSWFRFALRPEGALFVGKSETVTGDEWAALDGPMGIYRPKNETRRAPKFDAARLVASMRRENSGRSIRVRRPGPAYCPADPTLEYVHGHLLKLLPAPCVVVNRAGTVLYAAGRLAPILCARDGRFSARLEDLVDPELFALLDDALRVAWRDRLPSRKIALSRRVLALPSDTPQELEIDVQPIFSAPADQALTAIIFSNLSLNSNAQPKREDTGRERVRGEQDLLGQVVEADAIQTVVDEPGRAALDSRPSGRWAGKASSEADDEGGGDWTSFADSDLHFDIVSFSEGLQASNEELQSLNEEMQAVNAALSTKLDGLGVVQRDLQSMMAALDCALLILDAQSRIVRFNAHACEFVHLVEGDIGRPLADLRSMLRPDRLVYWCRRVQSTGSAIREHCELIDGRRVELRISPSLETGAGELGAELSGGLVVIIAQLPSPSAAALDQQFMVVMNGVGMIVGGSLDAQSTTGLGSPVGSRLDDFFVASRGSSDRIDAANTANAAPEASRLSTCIIAGLQSRPQLRGCAMSRGPVSREYLYEAVFIEGTEGPSNWRCALSFRALTRDRDLDRRVQSSRSVSAHADSTKFVSA